MLAWNMIRNSRMTHKRVLSPVNGLLFVIVAGILHSLAS